MVSVGGFGLNFGATMTLAYVLGPVQAEAVSGPTWALGAERRGSERKALGGV